MARLIHLGRVPYAVAWDLQKRVLDEVIAGGENTVILCEHEPVYTVGRKRGAMGNVLVAGDTPVVEVERGGDVTWHGPGQLVVYPILRLENADLHAHLRRLEQVVIDTCAALGVVAGRDDRNTGVWHGGRKFCSIGIACRRWVTWHGLAINVDVDLGVYAGINPCGFDASVMTTLSEAAGRRLTVSEVEGRLAEAMQAW